MALLAEYNPLGFYLSKEARNWFWTQNKEFIVIYPSFYATELVHLSLVPSFNLAFYTATTVDAAIYDCADTWMVDITTPTIVAKTGYKQVNFASETQGFQPDGFYYIKLNVDGIDYFSDMFKWSSDVTELLKIETISTPILMGDAEYELPDITHTFYLNAKYKNFTPTIKETAEDIWGITESLFGVRTVTRIWTVLGTEQILIFLSGLRIVRGNGEVLVTWKNRTFMASDIVAETETDHGGADLLNIKFEFKVKNESLQTLNSI